MADSKEQSEHKALQEIRRSLALNDPQALSAGILAGDRGSLSRAITLLESTRADHGAMAAAIIRSVMPASGKSIRIGITGVPGVGKSTFIEALGSYLIAQGKKVAVLAVDPSSPVSRGSILGDKTRMSALAAHPAAFIRPSPSAMTLGGVTRKTRESIALCEAAGFDVILVETVGVGQSETAVHTMTDFFLLLMLAGAGDQLQGIKRGIMEMCDALLITKSDGENVRNASRAKSEYFSALHLFPPKESGWTPRVESISALNGTGIEATWKIIAEHESWMKSRGLFEKNRQQQDINRMHEAVRDAIIDQFYADAKFIERLKEAEEAVRSGRMSPYDAAEEEVKRLRS